MPAEECENGKWKWGETGACKYDSKAEAEEDNADYYRALSDIDLTPTEGMIEEAEKGLEWRKEFGRGGTEVGVKTANMIVSKSLTPERVIKMYAYLKRHEVDKQAEGFEVGEDGYPSAGRIAWALWGGDAAIKFSERKRDEINKEEEKRVSARIKKALENKRDKHNEEISEMSLDWNGKVTLSMLEKVFDRGVGAYNTNPQSVRPSVTSSDQWALARTNSFLYAMKKGKYRGGQHDTDLLPKDHPVRKKMDEEKSLRGKVGTMITDGIELPLFDTIEEAEQMAVELGGEASFHIHTMDGKEYYMPFENHEEALEVIGNGSEMQNSYHDDEEEDEKKQDSKIKYVWDKKYNNVIMEKRIFNIETRAEENEEGRKVIMGHASMYNTRSENLGGFYEYIEAGAFTSELIDKSDVRALINHDQNLILGRTTSGTLRLNADDMGLRYEFDVPETSYGNDLLVSMKRGDITQSSFAFTVAEDDWSQDEAGNNIRTIKKIDRLYDVSPVTYPAYPDANDLVVAQRGLSIYKEKLEKEKVENDLVKRSLVSLKIELKKRK